MFCSGYIVPVVAPAISLDFNRVPSVMLTVLYRAAKPVGYALFFQMFNDVSNLSTRTNVECYWFTVELTTKPSCRLKSNHHRLLPETLPFRHQQASERTQRKQSPFFN